MIKTAEQKIFRELLAICKCREYLMLNWLGPGINILKNIRLGTVSRKRDHFARQVFASIVGGGSSINTEKIYSQHFVDRRSGADQ